MFLLHSRNRPCEELHRHHLCHIHAYAVYAFVRPEQQNIAHLDPGVGDRVKLFLSAALVENAVVQLDRLVPVAFARMARKTVVTRHFRGVLLIALQVFVHREPLTRQIIEVVQRRESPFRMVFLAQIFYARGPAKTFIFAAHMVRYEINQYAQTRIMSALDERFEFLHPLRFVLRQVGVYVIIIRDGVWRAGFAFGDGRMVICCGSVTDHAGVPNMRDTQIDNRFECTLVDIYKPAATVLFLAAVVFPCLVVVAEQPREELINDGFVYHNVYVCLSMVNV